ncbi:CAAX protease [Nonlabens dokdonensis]|uniref:CAAX protease n=1 Tax=Nonlabens dokdonensis TaxID=328515 RepID=A0A1Z8AJF6_9FLAO|nr:Abi family protein [Nonlabens dokdonensis]OUS10457.1 CAAX protease [Nonlabens dokdonensis]
MAKKSYTKQPLSFEVQLQLLKDRQLIVNNDIKALSYLRGVSYYRLSAYYLPFQEKKDVFNKGTNFQEIIDIYSFDRQLRLLVFDCIERLEIAIRTQFIYAMSMHHDDSHWQDNKAHFVKPYYNGVGNLVDPYSDLQNIISKAKTNRKPEVFIKHYIDTYNKPSNPPSWMCLELLTIGQLSHIYRGLRNKADKKRIADFFDVHPSVFQSWLHSITYVRNLCAHHSRLWNRDLAIEPSRLLKPVGHWVGSEFQNNKRVFYFICVLKYLLLRANPGNSLKDKLETLFEKYPNVPIKYIGIPSNGQGQILNWKEEALWK